MATAEPTASEKEESKKEEKQSEEDAKFEADMKREREKIQHTLAERRTNFWYYLKICLIAETVLCAMLASNDSLSDGKDLSFFSKEHWKRRLVNFTEDTLDCSILIAIRVTILLCLMHISIVFGQSDNWQMQEDGKPSRLMRLTMQVKNVSMLAVTKVMQKLNSNSNNEYPDRNIDTNHQRDHPSAKGSTSEKEEQKSTTTTTTTTIRHTFDLDDILRLGKQTEQKFDPCTIAEFYKTTLWLLLFSVISLFQCYIGCKIVFFKKCQSDPLLSRFVWEFSVAIALSHFEIYVSKSIIDASTQPSEQYFDKSVHQHPLIKRTDICTEGNWCDFCHERIRKDCYRCSECDFDVCHKCWKKRKMAKSRAENRLRTESGEDLEDRDVSYREYFTRLFGFYRAYSNTLMIGLSMTLLNSLIGVWRPSSKGTMLAYVTDGDMQGFIAAIKVHVVVTVLSGIIGSVKNLTSGRVSTEIVRRVQNDLFKSIMSQDMVFFDGSSMGDLNRRLNWGLNEMLKPFLGLAETLMSGIIGLIGSFVMCWTISWRLTLLAFSTLGPITYLSITFSHWYWQNMRSNWRLSNDIYMISHNAFQNIRTVRSFGKEPAMVSHYCGLREAQQVTERKAALFGALRGTIESWFGLISGSLIILAGGLLVLRGQSDASELLLVTQLITFESYWNSLNNHINRVRRMYPEYQRALFSARRVFNLLDAKPSIESLSTMKESEVHKISHKVTDSVAQITGDSMSDESLNEDTKEEEPTGNMTVVNREEQKDSNTAAHSGGGLLMKNGIPGDVKFEDVWYYYQMEPNKQVLKGVSLTIEKGKVTALVGRSGGGKSTLMHMLLRMYDPQKGAITIGGTNIKEFNTYSLRHNIAIVSQETELFPGQISHNIAYGVDSYTMQDVRIAAKLANCDDFIQTFEDGDESRVGDKGTRLSGGQKQRLAIARMLLCRPSLMLLDEATSSLDAESEALVQASLERAIAEQQCTVVIVAHRLSTVVNADKIAVIDDGMVVEEGTHDELLLTDGIYAKLIERQMNLKAKMKERVRNVSEGGGDGKKEAATESEIDSIDKLIDQIKAEKKERERKEGGKTGSEDVKEPTTDC